MPLSEAKNLPENLPAMENVPRARVSDVGGEDGSVVASSAMKKAHADLAAKWVLAEDGRTAYKAVLAENKRRWPHATRGAIEYRVKRLQGTAALKTALQKAPTDQKRRDLVDNLDFADNKSVLTEEEEQELVLHIRIYPR